MPAVALAADSFDLVRVIQAATAPVVLISAVGLLLLVLSNRLARIVDRTRLLVVAVRGGDTTQ